MLKLIIEDDEGRKTVVPFVRDEITIGRQEGNTIRLTERNVSRRHARLMRSDEQVSIEDLGSYNGVRINGDRISGKVPVADGDLIQIGDYDLAVQSEGVQQSLPTVPFDTAENTRKLHDTAPIPPPLRLSERAPQAADEDVREVIGAQANGESADTKHHATAVIRVEQLDSPTKRAVVDIEPHEAPRLVVLNTDFAGREFACTRTELKIGRTDDNEIALDHRSLSRTHCKLVREDNNEWRIIDMQSANGLMVNGETYAQITLRFGDVIELGHVKFKFVAAGEMVSLPTSPSSPSNPVTLEFEPPNTSKTPLIAIGITVLVLVGGVGGYLWWKNGQAADMAPKSVAAAKNPPLNAPMPVEPNLNETALVKLAEAKMGAADLDWSKAETLAKEATVEGVLIPEAAAFLEALESERGNRNALEQATKLLEERSLEKAKVQLEAASGTKLLRDRYDELENRRAQLVAEKLEVSKAPKPVAPPKPPVVAPPVPPKSDSQLAAAEALFIEAKAEKQAQNFERAAARLEKCIKLAPKYHPCYRQLGSVYASIASRDGSANDNEKARRYYMRFLEVAPADDEYVPRVKDILEQAKNQ